MPSNVSAGIINRADENVTPAAHARCLRQTRCQFLSLQLGQRAFAETIAQVIDQFVFQDAIEPGALAGAGVKLLPHLKRSDEHFLDQVFRLRAVTQAETGIAV